MAQDTHGQLWGYLEEYPTGRWLGARTHEHEDPLMSHTLLRIQVELGRWVAVDMEGQERDRLQQASGTKQILLWDLLTPQRYMNGICDDMSRNTIETVVVGGLICLDSIASRFGGLLTLMFLITTVSGVAEVAS